MLSHMLILPRDCTLVQKCGSKADCRPLFLDELSLEAENAGTLSLWLPVLQEDKMRSSMDNLKETHEALLQEAVAGHRQKDGKIVELAVGGINGTASNSSSLKRRVLLESCVRRRR